MNFSIAGSGNMAAFLLHRLRTAGHHCTGIYSRNTSTAQALSQTASVPVLTDPAALTTSVAACFLAVPDAELPNLAALLPVTDTVLIHTSGTAGLDALVPATASGVIWPVYSIVKSETVLHRAIPVVWEASSEDAGSVVVGFAQSLSDQVWPGDLVQRQWLHLCAVIGNNFTNHLVTICEVVCQQQQVPFALLRPILQQTFDRFQHQLPDAVQTGPARRNDVPTMERHAALLAAHPDWQAVYKAMSASIHHFYADRQES